LLRDAAISLSLANLCFVKVWSRVLSSAGSYFNEFPIVYASLIVDVVLLAACFWIGITLVRRSRFVFLARLSRWSLLLAMLTAANAIVTLLLTFLPRSPISLMGRSWANAAGIGVTLTTVFLVFIWRARILKFAPRVILALLPFVLLTFAQGVWRLASVAPVVAHAGSKPASVAPVPRTHASSRVLWIIFDELDQNLAFAGRPSTVKLPELDRLRSESVYATHAYPPAPLTYMSMPALISGRLVSRVTPISADELMIDFDGQRNSVPWSQQPSVFSVARQSGFTTGLAGWSHPYCEVIGASLTKCDEVKEKSGAQITIGASMFLQAAGLISTVPLVPQASLPLIQRIGFLNRIVTKTERQKYTVRYQHVLQSALTAATDRDLDLILVHSPMPHPPGIYDRAKQEFTLDSRSSYLDNLALVDRTVGELRRAMESAGTWQNTTVLISADHWWRTEMWARGPFWTKEDALHAPAQMDHRIPFLLKLAGQNQAVTYDQPFNTVVTHDLLLALLHGEVSTAANATDWLDRHRSIGDGPYNLDELLP